MPCTYSTVCRAMRDKCGRREFRRTHFTSIVAACSVCIFTTVKLFSVTTTGEFGIYVVCQRFDKPGKFGVGKQILKARWVLEQLQNLSDMDQHTQNRK